jgi:hypothetical protein
MRTVGIVACAKRKLPVPCPAWLLYSASGVFSQTFLAAKRSCDAVLILSGKHGLIDPERILRPYDRRLDPDAPGLRERLADELRALGPVEIVSYLPKDYEKAIALVPHRQAVSGNLFVRMKALGRQGSLKGRAVPSLDLLVWFYRHAPVSLRQIQVYCLGRQGDRATQRHQYNKLLRSPFVRMVNGLAEYAFLTPEE